MKTRTTKAVAATALTALSLMLATGAEAALVERLFDANGDLHKFVNIFVSDDDVRYLQGLDTPVKDGDTVSIIPAVAGGC